MKVFRLVCCLLALVLLSSCASRNLGTIREDHAVSKQFKSGKVQQNYNYFYYGVEVEPEVILAIDKKYTVESRFWTPVELTDERLRRWVVRLDQLPAGKDWSSRYGTQYQGAWVLDPEGNEVGIWYSRKDWGVFEYPGDNVIIPYVPSNHTGLSSNDGEAGAGEPPGPLQYARAAAETSNRTSVTR